LTSATIETEFNSVDFLVRIVQRTSLLSLQTAPVGFIGLTVLS